MQDDEVKITPSPLVAEIEQWRHVDWNEPRLIWKHVGIPESLHDMCELLGIIVRDDPKQSYGFRRADWVPQPEDFLIHLPLLSDPTQAAIIAIPGGIVGNHEAWLEVLTALANFRTVATQKGA